MTVHYEWDVETINRYGEVEDHYSEDKLRPDMALDAITYGNQRGLVLVRDDDSGRHWACSGCKAPRVFPMRLPARHSAHTKALSR